MYQVWQTCNWAVYPISEEVRTYKLHAHVKRGKASLVYLLTQQLGCIFHLVDPLTSPAGTNVLWLWFGHRFQFHLQAILSLWQAHQQLLDSVLGKSQYRWKRKQIGAKRLLSA